MPVNQQLTICGSKAVVSVVDPNEDNTMNREIRVNSTEKAKTTEVQNQPVRNSGNGDNLSKNQIVPIVPEELHHQTKTDESDDSGPEEMPIDRVEKSDLVIENTSKLVQSRSESMTNPGEHSDGAEGTQDKKKKRRRRYKKKHQMESEPSAVTPSVAPEKSLVVTEAPEKSLVASEAPQNRRPQSRFQQFRRRRLTLLERVSRFYNVSYAG